jgi:hypothetical protein
MNVESDTYRKRNEREEGMTKLLEELRIEGLTADCVPRKCKIMETVCKVQVFITLCNIIFVPG